MKVDKIFLLGNDSVGSRERFYLVARKKIAGVYAFYEIDIPEKEFNRLINLNLFELNQKGDIHINHISFRRVA